MSFQLCFNTASFLHIPKHDSEWDASICLHGETCAGHCAVGAVTQHNWAETYGVGQNGTGVDVGFFTQLVLLCTVRSGLEVGEWQGQQ